MKTKTSWAVALTAVTLGATCLAWAQPSVAITRYRIPAGTAINVRLDGKISTEDASSGNRWSGTVSQSVHANGRVAIPAGSPVSGIVTRSSHGSHNSRARLDLAIREVTVDGQTYSMSASTPPIIAGTKRAKKIGAIVGGAAAGALLGGAVSGSKKGALIGGVLGGAASYGLTRNAFRTLQLKPGTVVQFTTRQELIARRY